MGKANISDQIELFIILLCHKVTKMNAVNFIGFIDALAFVYYLFSHFLSLSLPPRSHSSIECRWADSKKKKNRKQNCKLCVAKQIGIMNRIRNVPIKWIPCEKRFLNSNCLHSGLVYWNQLGKPRMLAEGWKASFKCSNWFNFHGN